MEVKSRHDVPSGVTAMIFGLGFGLALTFVAIMVMSDRQFRRWQQRVSGHKDVGLDGRSDAAERFDGSLERHLTET